jgi:hypothetical protein
MAPTARRLDGSREPSGVCLSLFAHETPMRIPRSARTLLLTVAALALPAAAHAQITAHTTLASFLAATSAPGTDTFNSLVDGSTVVGPLTRSAGAYSYRATSSGDGQFYVAGTATDSWLSTWQSTSNITLSNFTSTVRGVGAYFFGNNDAGDYYANQTIRVTATTASGTLQQLLTNTTQATFLGFVSTQAFTSILVEVLQPPSGGTAYVTVNDLVLARQAIVPEPTTFALLATGLLLLLFIARGRTLQRAR